MPFCFGEAYCHVIHLCYECTTGRFSRSFFFFLFFLFHFRSGHYSAIAK